MLEQSVGCGDAEDHLPGLLEIEVGPVDAAVGAAHTNRRPPQPAADMGAHCSARNVVAFPLPGRFLTGKLRPSETWLYWRLSPFQAHSGAERRSVQQIPCQRNAGFRLAATDRCYAAHKLTSITIDYKGLMLCDVPKVVAVVHSTDTEMSVQVPTRLSAN